MSDKVSFEDLQFTSESQRNYFIEARLGQAVEDFLHSDVGKLLHHRAIKQYEDAKQGMCELDIDSQVDQGVYKTLKFQLKLADQFMSWCAEAIQNGQTSEQLVSELQENEA